MFGFELNATIKQLKLNTIQAEWNSNFELVTCEILIYYLMN